MLTPRQSYALQASHVRWQKPLQRAITAATPRQRRPERWRRDTETAVLIAVTAGLRTLQRRWQRSVSTQTAWPSAEESALLLFVRLRAPLEALYTRLWTHTMGEGRPPNLAPIQEALARASLSFAQTTTARLQAQVSTLPDHAPARMQQALTQVIEEALRVRVPAMMRTETARIMQAAARDAALAQGKTRAVWRTTSGHPCTWCAALEGHQFVATDGVFVQGTVLEDGTGKTMALDYADVWHPPLHPHCQCIVDYS